MVKEICNLVMIHLGQGVRWCVSKHLRQYFIHKKKV